ncbi:hypothetical protein E2986_01297 [Frieseomelitta varia]|uniref:EDR1/CTR1/ARMC3-like peptidase-like domain-containing protein n=1 Tax=Frieseomelitta varia TaxID=561572 RepID=A0A833RUU1_9HYME|nr:hypothetical protein E2986_01297 [Frieseomelitta varia]
MGPKREIKYVSKGKTRIDREQQTKNQFDPLRLEVKYPGTTIHLLQCDEKPILLAAAAALAKFGGKCRENLQLLFDLEITDSVIPLITHEDLFTRRFALKLLAEMVAIPNVRDFLLDSDYYIPHFIKVLINETDTFMHEFSSLILAEITKDVYGTAQLLKHCPDMNFLHERLQSPDPDVKMNTMQIVHNLLQDPIGAEEIIETKVYQGEKIERLPPPLSPSPHPCAFVKRYVIFQSFDLQLVYDLFDSPYTEIQKLALDVVADLVRRNKDDRLHDRFRRTNGLGALLKFLDNIEWEDLHADALRILRFACDNPTTVELFDDIGGIRHMLKYIEDTSNSRLFMEALGIAVRLSHTARGRKVTHHTTTHDDVSDILKNENLKLSTRLAALFALNQLLKCDAKNCQEFLDIHGQNYLLWLMRQPAGRVPVEILVGAVECVITIVRNQALRHTVITPEIIDAMCASFEVHIFPILDDIFRFKFCPLEPIYVVNCIQENPYELSLEGPEQASNDRGVFLSREILQLTMDSKFGLQCDSSLYDYVELFKCKLIAAESKNVVSRTTRGFVDVGYVASRARMLAKFVARQMSGPDPLVRCVDHQLEIHLKEIKRTIETSVIPLGMLKVGSYFERALLFKVIADRVHLPAALVRGQYGKAWIEIAVPEARRILGSFILFVEISIDFLAWNVFIR